MLTDPSSIHVSVDARACTGCGACIDACPVRAIVMAKQKAVIDERRCVRCTSCLVACEAGAIRIPFATAVHLPERN